MYRKVLILAVISAGLAGCNRMRPENASVDAHSARSARHQTVHRAVADMRAQGKSPKDLSQEEAIKLVMTKGDNQ